MPRKRKSNNPAGRPSQGLTEARFLVRLPAELDAEWRSAAAREGVDLAEWWRRAARIALDTVTCAR